jgi:hypothetical protein
MMELAKAELTKMTLEGGRLFSSISRPGRSIAAPAEDLEPGGWRLE